MKTRSNTELLNALRNLVAQVRGVTRELLVELGEVDARRLYLEEACLSMFAFCTTRLGFSEDVAYKPIQAARLGRRFPAVLRAFGAGRIHLAGLAILGPYMTRENHRELLAAASGLTKRQIEALVADRFPGATPPRRKGTLRRLRATKRRWRGPVSPVAGRGTEDGEPDRGVAARLAPGRANIGNRWDGEQAGKGSPAPSTRASKSAGDPALSPATASPNSTPTEDQSAAGAEALYSLSLTVGKGFAEKLEEARAQLSHSLPDGDLARILERGLDALLTDARRLPAHAFKSPGGPAGIGRAAIAHAWLRWSSAGKRTAPPVLFLLSPPRPKPFQKRTRSLTDQAIGVDRGIDLSLDH